ncbi:putative nuclease HARBI1 [Heterodontus francisci]|uniref:putative nuclease HARBI1 n=1 Tax=Heterodontus francisci TaxID=7792 RepID=UPI00355BAB78
MELVIISTPVKVVQKDLWGKKQGHSIDALLEDGRKYKAIVAGQQLLQELGAANSIGTITRSKRAIKLCVQKKAAHHCIKVVTNALFSRANNFISFKTDKTSNAERARRFSAIAGFPKVQGVVNCTHVAIRSPAGHSGTFINRKVFHSLNVQLVCDHRKRIMQVCERYPGSCHDAYILRNSHIPALFSPPDKLEGWILGNRGYPLKTWLMTPVRIPRGHAEERVNESHAATRVTIEQTIGLLKMRFSCLDQSGGSLQYAPARAFRIVCCALYNLVM